MKINKYRSWNKELNQFFYFKNGKYYKSISCESIDCISERICNEFNWNNAEQYIYKKDIKNLEVYDGDVMEGMVTSSYSDGRVFSEETKMKRYTVKIPDIYLMRDISSHKIVGNIHAARLDQETL